jgi:Tol biopolymer transport system component
VPPNPGDSKNCGDFDTYQQAKAWFDLYYPYYGDVANLDADDNLIPCESLSGSPEGFGLAENVAAGTTITLRVAGRGWVPKSGVSAVVMNVTAVEPTSFGYVQVAPTPVVPRATSNLNTAPGRTIANLVVVPLGAAGSVDLFTTTPADLVADVVGYFTDTTAPQSGQGLFVPITPDRQFDSRQPPPRNPLPADTITSIDVNDISPDAIAIAGNLTATQAVQPGYLQLAAPPISARTSSNLNLSYPGQTIANAVVSPVANGQLRLYNRNPTHELLDVTGWFTSAVSSLPPSPTTTTTTPKKTTTTTTTVEPTTTLPSDPDPKIAFTRANQIYTINPDGTGEAKLTSGNKNYWPRWSPDGNRIAYVHEVAGAHSLWVMNANGTNKQQITDQNTSYGPAWSPDGAWLAFGVTSGDPRWGNLARIKSTAPFGSPQAFPSWVDDPADLDPQTGIRGTPAWSASRNEIYFFGNDLTGIYDQAILAYDVATQELSMLTAIGGGGSYGSIAEPAISTDGTMLAYTYTLSPPSVTQEVGPLIDLYSYPSMTSLPFTTFEEDSQLAFSRTDTRVALMNDSAGAAQIFIAEADGSGRQPLTNGYQPDWQPR